MYSIGDKVIISSENDNYAYDSSMEGMQLMDFTLENGMEFPFSLYEYEVEYI